MEFFHVYSKKSAYLDEGFRDIEVQKQPKNNGLSMGLHVLVTRVGSL